jgi:hypothetical protein
MEQSIVFNTYKIYDFILKIKILNGILLFLKVEECIKLRTLLFNKNVRFKWRPLQDRQPINLKS